MIETVSLVHTEYSLSCKTRTFCGKREKVFASFVPMTFASHSDGYSKAVCPLPKANNIELVSFRCVFVFERDPIILVHTEYSLGGKAYTFCTRREKACAFIVPMTFGVDCACVIWGRLCPFHLVSFVPVSFGFNRARVIWVNFPLYEFKLISIISSLPVQTDRRNASSA